MTAKKYIFVFFFVAAACRSAVEKPLPVPVMKSIVWDMMIADEWYNTLSSKDSTGRFRNDNIAMYEKVFSLHKISRSAFYNSYRYYETHPEQMKILVDSIEQYSSREKNKLMEARNAKLNNKK